MNQTFENEIIISSRRRRIAAFIIDHFVLVFLTLPIAFRIIDAIVIDETNMSQMAIRMLIALLPVFLLYAAKDSIRGISLGKWAMGIMVRDAENLDKVPSFGRLLLRNSFLTILPIELIILLSSDEKKRLGDKAAKAIVIRNPNKPARFIRVLTLIGVLWGSMMLSTVSTLQGGDAYKVATEAIQQNQEIIDEVVGIKGFGRIPTGSIHTSNGYGEAQLQVKVLGNTRDMHVDVHLTKEPNKEWQLIEMNKTDN